MRSQFATRRSPAGIIWGKGSASRVDAAARKLRVSRSLLLREAIARGLKPAMDFLRREERPEAPAGNEL